MTNRHIRFVSLLGLLCALIAISSPGAQAQNDPSRANLQKENDQLRERVAQLEARAKQLEQENQALKQEVDRLRAAAKSGGTGGPGTPGAPPKPGSVPTTGDVLPLAGQEALSCPDALLAALQADYTKVFKDRKVEDATKAQYVLDVRKWAHDAERTFKGNIDWVVRIDKENLPTKPEEPIPFWVIDAKSGKLLHPRPVKAVLPARVAAMILKSPDSAVWDFKGQLGATPTPNPDRPEVGLLDFPAFIGPFAEFQYSLNVRSATVHEQK